MPNSGSKKGTGTKLTTQAVIVCGVASLVASLLSFLCVLALSEPFVETSTKLTVNVYLANTLTSADQYGYNCEYSWDALIVHMNTYFAIAKITASRSFSATLFVFFSCALRLVILQMPSNTAAGSLYTRLLHGQVLCHKALPFTLILFVTSMK